MATRYETEKTEHRKRKEDCRWSVIRTGHERAHRKLSSNGNVRKQRKQSRKTENKGEQRKPKGMKEKQKVLYILLRIDKIYDRWYIYINKRDTKCMVPGIWYVVIYYIIIYNIISYDFKRGIMSYHIISYHIISNAVSYHIISFQTQYHIISYHM